MVNRKAGSSRASADVIPPSELHDGWWLWPVGIVLAWLAITNRRARSPSSRESLPHWVRAMMTATSPEVTRAVFEPITNDWMARLSEHTLTVAVDCNDRGPVQPLCSLELTRGIRVDGGSLSAPHLEANPGGNWRYVRTQKKNAGRQRSGTGFASRFPRNRCGNSRRESAGMSRDERPGTGMHPKTVDSR